MRRLAISEEEKQFFLENGYLIAREALEAEELQRVRAAMDELTKGEEKPELFLTNPNSIFNFTCNLSARTVSLVSYSPDWPIFRQGLSVHSPIEKSTRIQPLFR